MLLCVARSRAPSPRPQAFGGVRGALTSTACPAALRPTYVERRTRRKATHRARARVAGMHGVLQQYNAGQVARVVKHSRAALVTTVSASGAPQVLLWKRVHCSGSRSGKHLSGALRKCHSSVRLKRHCSAPRTSAH